MNTFNLQKILDFFNYIFWFFCLNIFFLIFNTPLVLFFLFVGLDQVVTYLPLFLVCSIPLMPSITVLFYCMNKIIKYKDLDLFYDIYMGIKLNIKQSILLWCFELFIIFILSINVRFFTQYEFSLLFNCMFITLFLILLLITPYIYLLISRFSLKSYDLIKNALILAVTRPLITISNILILLFCMILFEVSPGTTILFASSIFTFLISYNSKLLLNNLEELSN